MDIFLKWPKLGSLQIKKLCLLKLPQKIKNTKVSYYSYPTCNHTNWELGSTARAASTPVWYHCLTACTLCSVRPRILRKRCC